MARKATASPADVRAWARENGLTVGTRGRFSPEVRDAYNKANRHRPYREAEFVKTVTVQTTTVSSSGRKVPLRKNVNVAEARKALVAAGHAVGSRGRLPQEKLAAFATGSL